MTSPTEAVTAAAKVIHGLHSTEGPDEFETLRARKALEAAEPHIRAEILTDLAENFAESASFFAGSSRGPEAARTAELVAALANDARVRATRAGN